MTHHIITKKDYLIGTGIIALSFVAQPFFMMLTQRYIAPKLAEIFTPQTETAGLGGEIPFAGNHIRGNENAKVFMVEYSDYECPFCQSFHNTAKKVFDNSNNEVAWIYKHFPLQFHANAIPSAVASECVAKLGGNDKFWAFSDMLFASQKDLSATALAGHAKMLGINMNDFNVCIKDPAILAKVNTDQSEGSSFGVQGTPNTFIAKKVGDKLVFVANINGAQPESVVSALIAENANKEPSQTKTGFFARVLKAFGL
jgi:protein-disulfide isomerase